jgi:hypothetical protein
MADEPAGNFHYGHNLPPLTHTDQGFVLLVASAFFFTTNRADRAFIRTLCREALPLVNRDHAYLQPIVALVAAQDDPGTAPAQTATLNTELSQRIHDFLRWRGLMALAKAQELGQIKGPT